ncbi:MAG: hypothetical protein AAFN40_28335, partial [Cyanobacteria bacterium J06560_6]
VAVWVPQNSLSCKVPILGGCRWGIFVSLGLSHVMIAEIFIADTVGDALISVSCSVFLYLRFLICVS